jgi:hypothetical protein
LTIHVKLYKICYMNEIIILKKVPYLRQDFIDLCVDMKTTDALAEHVGCARMTVHRCLKKYFPNLPAGNRLDHKFLELEGKRRCHKCDSIKAREEFREYTNVSSYCIPCELPMRNKFSMDRHAAKLQRTPAWANHDKIKEVYENCPEGHEVDHIIPLQGDLVSGLHVENNLQYLTKYENCSKGNRYTP